MAKKKYNVLSPDGFSIHREKTYPSTDAAVAAYDEWKKGYERQGYYSSASYGRIPLEDLDDYCQIVEV